MSRLSSAPSVIYVDSVRGGDTSGVAGDPAKPFASATAAAAVAIAGDVIRYTPRSVDPSNLPSVPASVKFKLVGTEYEPRTVGFTITAAAANVCEVLLTVKDSSGNALAGVFNLDVWLSDAATGAGLTATSASGTVTAKANSGEVVGTYSAKKALRVQTLATGKFTLEITDTAKTEFYVCATVPGSGATVVSSQLAAASYGA